MASQDANTEDMEEVKGNAHTVGALLKASRLRLGDDLRNVAETLHIRYIYLEAIEDGNYDELPGAAYAIGFIRSYADHLGLDSEEVVRRYKAESSSQPGGPQLVFPVPVPESSIPGGAIIFVGVVIALLAYGGWYVSTAKDGFLAGLVSPVPERLSEEKPTEEPEMKTEPVEPRLVDRPPETEPEPVEDTVQETVTKVADNANETVDQVVAAIEPEVTQESSPESLQETLQEAVQETVVEAEQAAPETGRTIAETPETTSETVVEKVEEVVTVETDDAASQVTPEPPQVEDAPVAEQLQEEEPSAETASVEAPETSAAEQVEAEPASASADEAEVVPVENTEPAAEPESTQTASVPATPAPDSSGRVYGSENESSRILVKARKNSWIQVRDNNANRLVLTRLLRAGDSYRVPDQEGLVLLTGNAGALEILVDGESVPDLGDAGKVRRNVSLDPDLLRQGTAAN